MYEIHCNACQLKHFVNTRPDETFRITCPYCQTYIGSIVTDAQGNDEGALNKYGRATPLHNDPRGYLESGGYMGHGHRFRQVGKKPTTDKKWVEWKKQRDTRIAKLKAAAAEIREMTKAYTGKTTKLVAKLCRHCGAEIPEMLDDTAKWCSFCGGDIER